MEDEAKVKGHKLKTCPEEEFEICTSNANSYFIIEDEGLNVDEKSEAFLTFSRRGLNHLLMTALLKGLGTF